LCVVISPYLSEGSDYAIFSGRTLRGVWSLVGKGGELGDIRASRCGRSGIAVARVKIGFATQFENKFKRESDTADDACVLDCFSGSMIRANNTRKMEHSCYICTAVLKQINSVHS
jgi:hypothetical protein